MYSFLSRFFKGDTSPIAKTTIQCVDSKDDEKYGLDNACERKTFSDATELQCATENYFNLSDNECDSYRNYAIGYNSLKENEKAFTENDYVEWENCKRLSGSDSDVCDERLGNYVNSYFNNFYCDNCECENGECSDCECHNCESSNREGDNDKYNYEEDIECEDRENEYCGYYSDEHFENAEVGDSVSEDGNFTFGRDCFEKGFTKNEGGACDSYERDNIEYKSDESDGSGYEKPYFNNFNSDDSGSEDSESSGCEGDTDACHYEEDSDCEDGDEECSGYSRDENYDNSKFDDSDSEDSEYDSNESDGSEYDQSDGSYEDYENDCSDASDECDGSDSKEYYGGYSYNGCDVNESDNSRSDFAYDNTTSCDLSEEDNELVSSDAEIKENHLLQVFFAFYEDLHDFIGFKISISEHAVKRSIKRLIYNYSHLELCKTPEELNFNDINTCIGYLHRYGICHAAMVCHAMIKVIEASTAITNLLAEQRLNLVCLGSGPGNDFIGLLFALIYCRVGITELDVTVVDRSLGWKVIFTNTIERMTFCGVREDDAASFIEADLVNFATWNDKMRRKLKSAHIVTLVKVLSNISKVDHFEILKNIIRYMEDDALLILIDCPLPFVELHKLQRFLLLVYKSEKEVFTFSKKKTRFEYPNIKKCSAYVRVYRKRNSHLLGDE